MKLPGALDYRRLALVLIPTLVVFGGSGVIALPELREVAALNAADREALLVIDEAVRVRPLLAHYQSAGTDDLATVRNWLSRSAPVTPDPRIFFADLRLIELELGLSLSRCEEIPDSESEADPEGSDSDRVAGSVWNIALPGDYSRLLSFLALLTRGERLYLPRAVRIAPTEDGILQLQLILFVPGLTPGQTDARGSTR
ncbi:MAG: hypothetical protein R3F20_19775 [Planctomycetota bacterium]